MVSFYGFMLIGYVVFRGKKNCFYVFCCGVFVFGFDMGEIF